MNQGDANDKDTKREKGAYEIQYLTEMFEKFNGDVPRWARLQAANDLRKALNLSEYKKEAIDKWIYDEKERRADALKKEEGKTFKTKNLTKKQVKIRSKDGFKQKAKISEPGSKRA